MDSPLPGDSPVISESVIALYDDNALHELAGQVGEALRAQRLMLCTAESCTGGPKPSWITARSAAKPSPTWCLVP